MAMKKLHPTVSRQQPKRLVGAALTAVVGGGASAPSGPNQTAFYQPNINGIEEN
jgi:hypothetical protein